jgi:hypothetical protein
LETNDWFAIEGNFDGRASTVACKLSDGYTISITLEENSDGQLVSIGMGLEQADSRKPIPNITSKYFQSLSFGGLLSEARLAYGVFRGAVEEVGTEKTIQALISEWPNSGASKFPDVKYAAVAWMYESLLQRGSSNPVTDLAEIMGCEDRDTASVRIIEARSRGLLTSPTKGSFGGKLTAKGKKLLEAEGGDKNAKKGKPNTRRVKKEIMVGRQG